jgi:methyltransferase (TIGR00027 family)
MRHDRPSLTAAIVAAARGIGTRGEVPDPVAAALLPGALGGALDAVARSIPVRSVLRPAARGLSFGMVDHLTLRTAAIDGVVRSALSQGIDQVVVLGAGLDARAWRLPELANADVFEIDHPASQAYKRQRIGDRPPLARSVHFISVDFEQQRLDDALAQCAHDPTRPTLWIWEGVTMYLQPAAIEATLHAVADRSAAGSLLTVTYVLPQYVPREIGVLLPIVDLVFSAFGEPLLGSLRTEDLGLLLRGAEFSVVSDTCSEDWARAEGSNPLLPAILRAERLTVAVREPQ